MRLGIVAGVGWNTVFSLRRGHFDAAETVGILRYSLVEGLGNFLAVILGLKLLFVGRIADERDFRQDAGHVGADQHHEWGFLHAPIAHVALGIQSGVQRVLHVGGEL